MPTILIEHPNHGRMHVYSQGELAQHIEWGWSEVSNEKPVPLNSAAACVTKLPPAPPPTTAAVFETAPPTVQSSQPFTRAPTDLSPFRRPRAAKSKGAL